MAQAKNSERVKRIIRFIEQLTVPSGKGAGKPFKLRKFQKRFIQDVYGPTKSDVRIVRRAILAMGRKNGKSVFEEKFRDVSGLLISMEIKENDYGKQWIVEIKDGDDRFIVNIPHASRYSTSLLKSLPNIDLSKPIRLMPWSMADKNDATKKVTGITIYQDGKKIEAAYTKEKPNGLPQMVQVKIKGSMVWDSSDMDEFLEKMAMEKFSKPVKKEEPVTATEEKSPW